MDEQQELSAGRHRLNTAEGRALQLDGDALSNVVSAFQSQTRLYRLNRGRWDTAAGVWRGFDPTISLQAVSRFPTSWPRESLEGDVLGVPKRNLRSL